jgi:hypothetical protein
MSMGRHERDLARPRGRRAKPVMLSEFGSAADPRSPDREAAWYQSIVPVIRQMPRLKALIQWNASIPGCHLGVPKNSPQARAYRQTGLDPYLPQRNPVTSR